MIRLSDLISDAGALVLSGKIDEGLKKYDEAIKDDPQNPLSYIEKAAVLKALNRFEEACADIDSALGILRSWDVAKTDEARYDSFYSMLVILKAETLLAMDKADECLSVLENQSTDDAAYSVVKAQALAALNKYEDAFDCLYKAEEWCFLNTDEMLTNIWLLKIRFAKEVGAPIAPPYAKTVYELERMRRPKGTGDEIFEHANNLRNLGLLYDALHYYRVCLESNPSNKALVLFFTGIVFEQLKEFDKAFSCYSDALAAGPDAEDEFKIRVRWANAKMMRG